MALADQIAALEEALELGGVVELTENGRTTRYADPAKIAEALARLKAQLTHSAAGTGRGFAISPMKLSGPR